MPYPTDALTTGTILGMTIACLSVEQQVHFHQGHEPTGTGTTWHSGAECTTSPPTSNSCRSC
ncbi:nucleotidyltransferase domain-containing protein [Planotetraspora silvatica]|uniref:nucleotidyltransferase domain-containing protein n=1 Tax=Planotetraspora silvatica TaxID=234614 RepID=UPI003571788C